MAMSSEETVDRVEFIHEKLVDVETSYEDLVKTVRDLQETVEHQDQRIGELERHLDLQMQLVANGGSAAEQRRSALLQHLVKKPQRKGAQERGYSAALTRNQAEEALHHEADVHRTMLYDDLETIRQKIGDQDVCYWDESSTPKRLVLDLDALADTADLPEFTEVSSCE